MWPNPRETVNLLTFTEKILNPLSANPQNGETDSKIRLSVFAHL